MVEVKMEMYIKNGNPASNPFNPGFGIRHVQVIVMSLSAAIMFMIRTSMGVAILHMTDQSQINNTNIEIYDWSEEIRGVVLSSYLWGYLILQLPAAILAKKIGAKPLVFIALLLNGALCLILPIMAKWGDWIAVCAIQGAMGLTQACLLPCNHTFLGKWAPKQERSVLSVVAIIGVQMGIVVTMPLCGILASTQMGWPLIFYTMGCLSFATSIVFWSLTASSPREHRLIKEPEIVYIETSLNSCGMSGKELPIPWKQILKSIPLYAIGSAHIANVWCFTLFLVLLPTYLKNGLGIDMAGSATMSALPFFSFGLIHLFCSYLADMIYNKNIMSLSTNRKMFNSIGSFGTAACLIGLSYLNSGHKIFGIALATFALGFLGATNCSFMLNHLDITPNFAGITYAITNAGSILISILTPISAGLILGDQPTDPARWSIVFWTAAAIAIICDIFYRILGTSEVQAWNDTENKAENNKVEMVAT